MIRNRGKNKWQIRLEMGTDPVTGERAKPDYRTFLGTKKEAQSKEDELKLEIKQGTYVRLTRMTMGEYLDDSLGSMPSLRPRTYEGYESMVRVHLKPSLGSIRLQELRPIHLQQYYQDKRDTGLSECTLLHHHRFLHTVLDKAVRLQLVAYNPATRVTAPKAVRDEPSALSEKQLIAILGATQGTELEIPTLLATVTGMRRGEVLGLTWDNVDLDEAALVVGQTLQRLKTGLTFQPPKTRRSARVVSLPAFAVKRLREEEASVRLALGRDCLNGVLVCRRTDGRMWDPTRLSCLFGQAMKDSGLPEVHFHTLRHAQASLLLRRGLDIQATGTRLGHSTSATTLSFYAHTIQETDRTAARMLDRALSGAPKRRRKSLKDSSGARMVPEPALKVVEDKAS